MRLLALLPLIAMTAACAMDGEMSARSAAREAESMAKLDALLANYTPGEPRSCVNSRNLRGPTAYGDRTLIFRDGSTIWRNETTGGCDEAGRDALVTRQFGPQLCRGEIARTVDLTGAGSFQSGSCALGDFVPYRRR